MSDAVLTALIVAASSIICQLLISRSDRKKRTAEDVEKERKRAVEQAVKDERLENRLKSIEQKLDVHNGYAEKLGNIEKSIAVIENDIKTLYKKGE